MCFAECIRRRHKISLYAVFHCGAEQNTVLALFAYCDIDLPRAAADAVFEIRIFGAESVFKVGQIVFSYAVSLFVFAKSRFFQAVYYVHLTIDRCNRLFNLFVALEINFVAGYVAFYFLSVAAPEKQVYAKAAQTKYKNIYNNENKHKAAICTHRFRGASDYQFCYQNAAKSEKSRGIEIQNRLKDKRYPEKISIVTAIRSKISA